MGYVLEANSLAQTQGQESFGPLLFHDVNFRWEAPSLHVVMGPSGAGKSSLLKSIGGVWKPSTGEVFLDGKPLWLPGSFQQNRQLLGRIGFAFQNNALFNSLRVIENLTLPRRQRFPDRSEKEHRDLAMEWLSKVELAHTAGSFPHELSGGMQKRLAIARTLILEPDYIFLDDPTAGLDPITSKVIAELISSLLKGSHSLVVIVTNDPDRAKHWGPHIHYLSEKTLISADTPRYSSLAELYT